MLKIMEKTQEQDESWVLGLLREVSQRKKKMLFFFLYGFIYITI